MRGDFLIWVPGRAKWIAARGNFCPYTHFISDAARYESEKTARERIEFMELWEKKGAVILEER